MWALPTTVTSNVVSTWFPEASSVTHETGVTPTGKMDPDVGSHVVVGSGSTMSVADTVKFARPPNLLAAFTTGPSGATALGGTVSVTVTV